MLNKSYIYLNICLKLNFEWLMRVAIKHRKSKISKKTEKKDKLFKINFFCPDA